MPETHVLSSGLIIRQDFAEAVRPVFLQTAYEEFLYATHGGTLFLVVYRGRVYGVTCAHVFGDFPHGKLFVTQKKLAQKGSMPGHVTQLGRRRELQGILRPRLCERVRQDSGRIQGRHPGDPDRKFGSPSVRPSAGSTSKAGSSRSSRSGGRRRAGA